MKAARSISVAVLALMAVQAVLGLLLPGEYHDVAWIKATWFGNDLVTLVVAVPLLAAGLALAARGSVRGTLLWLGGLGYAVYNYGFYMLGVALNAFFPLYVVLVVLSAAALVLSLPRTDVDYIAAAFARQTPVRLVGGFLVFVATGLSLVWLGTWAAYAFAGRPTPVEPEAFRLVAALDLSLMVPALSAGGIMLWRRRAWGYLLASIAAIQGALYLLVLTLNSVLSIRSGLAEAPGELPVWAPLLAGTAACAVTLVAHAKGRRA